MAQRILRRDEMVVGEILERVMVLKKSFGGRPWALGEFLIGDFISQIETALGTIPNFSC